MDALSDATEPVQTKMMELFTKCDPDYGQRVQDGLNKAKNTSHELPAETIGVKSKGSQKLEIAYSPRA